MRKFIFKKSVLHTITFLLAIIILVLIAYEEIHYVSALFPFAMGFCYLAAFGRAYEEGLLKGTYMAHERLIKLLDDKIKETQTKTWK